jgi:hypothetical protein
MAAGVGGTRLACCFGGEEMGRGRWNHGIECTPAPVLNKQQNCSLPSAYGLPQNGRWARVFPLFSGFPRFFLLTGKYDIIVFLVRDIKMDCYGRVYKL